VPNILAIHMFEWPEEERSSVDQDIAKAMGFQGHGVTGQVLKAYVEMNSFGIPLDQHVLHGTTRHS